MKRSRIIKLAGLVAVFAAGLVLFAGIRSQTRASKVFMQNPSEKAAAYSKQMRGLSLLIIKDGKTVLEHYENGHASGKDHTLYSGTKSFSGVMLAAAIEDGLFKGFDDKISDTIIEWKTDATRSEITLRQLLSLTSGLNAGGVGKQPSYKDALKSPVSYPAGSTYEYGPVPFQIFGEVMRRKLERRGETVEGYLNRKILAPLEMKAASWEKIDGQPLLPSGASMTAREWAKFGVFLLNEGKVNGKQIVKADLLRELSKGAKTNPNYGITFWLNGDNSGKAILAEKTRRERAFSRITGRESETDHISKNGFGTGLPNDIFTAAGAGKQRLYIIPSEKMVVVRQGRFSKFDDEKFLRLLLGH